jgi:hypothetical protein
VRSVATRFGLSERRAGRLVGVARSCRAGLSFAVTSTSETPSSSVRRPRRRYAVIPRHTAPWTRPVTSGTLSPDGGCLAARITRVSLLGLGGLVAPRQGDTPFEVQQRPGRDPPPPLAYLRTVCWCLTTPGERDAWNSRTCHGSRSLAVLGRPMRRTQRAVVSVSVSQLQALRADPDRAIEQDRIVCLSCGRVLRQLTNTHLRIHGERPEAYKARWGYPRSEMLAGREVREHYRRRAVAVGQAGSA